MDDKPLILIVCTGNYCRSPMAEGILRSALGETFDVQSAGVEPVGGVSPLAVEAMREIGIDIANHQSKHVSGFLSKDVETVITLCDYARGLCPRFPGERN